MMVCVMALVYSDREGCLQPCVLMFVCIHGLWTKVSEIIAVMVHIQMDTGDEKEKKEIILRSKFIFFLWSLNVDE